MNWLHRLLNPHCPECDVCKSCEVLKTQLTHANYEKEMLLKLLVTPKMESKDSNFEPALEEDMLKSVRDKMMPWSVRRNMLEAEDRERARILRKNKEEQEQAIKNLEEELKLEIPGVENESQS